MLHRRTRGTRRNPPQGSIIPVAPPHQTLLQEHNQSLLKYQACHDLITWTQKTQGHFLRGAIQRRIRAEDAQREREVELRRGRLKQLLQQEELQMLQELERVADTAEGRKQRLMQVAQQMRERREKETQKWVEHQLDRQFRVHCDGLRVAESRREEVEGNKVRLLQLQTRQEQQREEEEEERLFLELWRSDGRAKEEREQREEETRQRRYALQKDGLLEQLHTVEQQRQREKDAVHEESARRKQLDQQNMLLTQQEELEKKQKKKKMLKFLQDSLKEKQDRVQREEDEEMTRAKAFLAQVQQEVSESNEEAVQRKAALMLEHRQYQQFLRDIEEQQRQNDDETHRLFDDVLQQNLNKTDERTRKQREARRRMMTEVTEGRRLQVQEKHDRIAEKRAEWVKDKEDLDKQMAEVKIAEKDERIRSLQKRDQYRTFLMDQIRENELREREITAERKRDEERRKRMLLEEEEKIRQIVSSA